MPTQYDRIASDTPGVLFLGMRGQFSLAPLLALLAAGIAVRAVVMPAERGGPWPPDAPPLRQHLLRPVPRSTLPLLTPYQQQSIASLAGERGIPVLEVARQRDPAVPAALAALAAYEPDILCVACWPHRLPPALLAVPRLGALNLHPSLLPAHRGPAPLFWTFRHGEHQTGATIHLMDETLDGGDILAQAALDVADGITGAELERQCAELGGRLMVDCARALAAGAAHPRAQTGNAASYEPWPSPEDFIVTPEHPARWAFNFLRGAAYWGGSLTIAVAGQRFIVRGALDYTAEGTLDAPYRQSGSELWLPCAPGILHAEVE